MFAGKSIAISADEHVSVASGKSLLGVAIEKVRIFAYKMGIKIFAAKGKVEIQAQSDDLDVIAEKVLRILSAKERVHISAPKEILLTAGESYIKIDASGVESGTKGRFIAYAAAHNFVGPKTKTPLEQAFKNAKPVCEVCEEKKKKK